ncbi:MAG: mandelate racemase/muconate lactonizing enzyme family protein [Candidatus Latescibacterota bacterium]|jgi:galactonate dehydratase
MRITDYHTLVLGTPWRNITYLVVETDAGLVGYGESRVVGKTHTVLEYLRDIRRHIVGFDPFDIEALYRRLTLLDFGKPGEVVMTGLALVELACWDLVGKACGQPVYRLVGGKVRDRVPAYANGWYTGERTPEAFAEAARAVVARGYRGMKFDPFGNGDLELSREELRRSMALVAAVREAVGPEVELFIEMHGRFAPHQAIEIARALEEYRPGWIEEPVRPHDLPALAQVARQTAIPIATGERLYGAPEYRELWPLRAAHVVQPDMTQGGGFLETKKIAAFAEVHSVMVALHNVGGIVSTAAALQLMATLRNGKVLEHFNDFADAHVKQAGSPYPEVADGCFTVADGPGWGIDLDESFIAAHPPTRVAGVVQDPGLNMFENAVWNRRGQDRP